MTLSLGDAASLFAGLRHSGALKGRLAVLTQELSTGQMADPAARLGPDRTLLAGLDRGLGLARAFGQAAAETADRLAAADRALGAAAEARLDLVAALIPATGPGPAADRRGGVEAGGRAFEAVVAALNARFGEAHLFSGTATDRAPLPPAETLLAGVRAAAAGATTAADVAAALAVWFDDPAGGYAAAYGGTAAAAARAVDTEETVLLPARADDPALRDLLRAAALAALAGDPALPPPEQAALLGRARDAAISAGDALVELRAATGREQGRAEEAAQRHADRASALAADRAALLAADPFATASELQALQTRIETHYAVIARLSALSLAGFLR
jgi:flagellar hook-associated protein 3 FlgL